jgi:RNase H-fold protein (predicted Holliday junction resolvase)
MKAKIEDERKKLKDVKNMAEEEKNKIKFELKRQEDELAKVRILCFTFSLNPLRFSLTRETKEKLTKQTVKSQKLSNF